MKKFSEEHEIRMALVPDADAFADTKYTDVFGLVHYRHITFIVQIGTVTSSGKTTITVEKCTAKAGTGNTAMAFQYRTGLKTGAMGALTAATTAGISSSTTSNAVHVIEIDAEELGDGYDYVRLKMVEATDQAVDAAILAILSDAAYSGDSLPISTS